MKRHLSRKEFLSASISGGLGLIGYSCTLEDVQPDLDAGNSSSATSTSSAATSGTTGSNTVGSGGSGGSGTSTSASSTSSTGSSGAGGSSATGSGGSGGAGGKGGAGGVGAGGKGGTGGAGGAGGAGGGGGKGGSGGSGGKAGGGGGGSKDAGAGGGGQDGGGMCNGNITANISMNHAGMLHGLVIPMADIMAAVTKVYVTTNVPGMTAQNHMHYVQVTAAEFMQLKAGMTVKKHSCSGGDHEYVLKCGGTTDMGGAPTCADECGGTMANACPT